RVDFDTAVHRPRMHHQRIRFGVSELLLVETEIMEVLLARRHERAVHALALQPQHHHDIGTIEAFAHVARDLDTHALDATWQQRGGGHHADAGTHGVEQQDIGARYPGRHHVTADRDDEPFTPAFAAADRPCAPQRL